MKRTVVMLVSLGLIVGAAATGSAQTSAAGPKPPVRSGTIAGGTGVIFAGQQPAGERWGCEYSVECQAWWVSGCDSRLAGQDPAVTASIVDVGALADGRTRRSFKWDAFILVHPGAVIQFWRQNCTEIPDAERHTHNPYRNKCGTCEPFRIPRGAKWMTVSANWTTAHLTWTLS